MKKTRVLLAVLALLVLALPASGKEHVYVDYDHEVDFSKFKTFMYAPAQKGMLAQDPLVDDFIVKGLIRRLVEGGMKQVETGADLLVTYEISSQTGQRVNVTGFTFYGGSSWGWGSAFDAGYGYGGGGWYVPTTMMTTYKSGTLFVAGFDTSTEMGVWRGAGEIVNVRTPAKAFKKVDKSLDKMVEKWHHMRKGE
jgi:hypothetical protein